MLASAKNPQEFHKILDKSSSTFSQEDSYAESDDSTTNYYKKKKKKKTLILLKTKFTINVENKNWIFTTNEKILCS